MMKGFPGEAGPRKGADRTIAGPFRRTRRRGVLRVTDRKDREPGCSGEARRGTQPDSGGWQRCRPPFRMRPALYARPAARPRVRCSGARRCRPPAAHHPKKFEPVIAVTSRSNKAAYPVLATRSSSPTATDPPLPGRGLRATAGNLFLPSRIIRLSAAARSPVDGLADRKGEIIGMIDFVPCACPR